ncbi:hypothetical protein MMC21_007001 [Puttea exsequens]|nr:hypothetical protein [Puttea exsequens]
MHFQQTKQSHRKQHFSEPPAPYQHTTNSTSEKMTHNNLVTLSLLLLSLVLSPVSAQQLLSQIADGQVQAPASLLPPPTFIPAMASVPSPAPPPAEEAAEASEISSTPETPEAAAETTAAETPFPNANLEAAAATSPPNTTAQPQPRPTGFFPPPRAEAAAIASATGSTALPPQYYFNASTPTAPAAPSAPGVVFGPGVGSEGRVEAATTASVRAANGGGRVRVGWGWVWVVMMMGVGSRRW